MIGFNGAWQRLFHQCLFSSVLVVTSLPNPVTGDRTKQAFFLDRKMPYYCLVKGSTGATRQHPTIEVAQGEARRLFELQGRKHDVYVLEAVETIKAEIVCNTPPVPPPVPKEANKPKVTVKKRRTVALP